MEFGLLHMARYGVILRLDGALWLTIIFKPLLTQKGVQKKAHDSKNMQYFAYFPGKEVKPEWAEEQSNR